MAGVPSHGDWCATRTFPTKCRECDASVFYFTCNCGSAVLFDDLGPPWPEHHHRHLPLPKKLEIAFRSVGKNATERYIEAQMMTGTVDARYGRRIERAYRKTVQTSIPSRPPPREILREDPYAGATTEEMGVVRELLPAVDIYARLELPRTTIAAAALGDLGSGTYSQVTIHTAALGEPDDLSYTFLVESRKVASAGLQREQLVLCRLRGVQILDRDPVWLCDHLEVV